WLLKNRDGNARLARWSLSLQEYTFDVIHKSGRKHNAPDCLSRNPVEEETEDAEDIPLFAVTSIDMSIEQANDKYCNKIRATMLGEYTKKAKRRMERRFEFIDGILYKKVNQKFGSDTLLVVPEGCKRQILEGAHSSKEAGHLGIRRTL